MIARATLSDGVTDYEIEFENVTEQPIVNANTTITIGGIVNSQADTERRKPSRSTYRRRIQLHT